MGKFAPVFLAFILNSFGVAIFRDISNVPCGPLVSCSIFMLAVFLLLWELRLYPCDLRRLGRIPHLILEFLVAIFMMEYILADFWNPLENFLITITPKSGELLHDFLDKSGIGCKIFFCELADFLRSDVAAIIMSYLLSTFFLTCVMHATRVVDFRLLSCGFHVFWRDIVVRLKKTRLKLLRYYSGTKKKIRFKNPIEEDCCPPPNFSPQMIHPHHMNDHSAYTNSSTNKKCKRCERSYVPRQRSPSPPYEEIDSNNDEFDSQEDEYSDNDCEVVECINNNGRLCSRRNGKY